MELCQHRAPAAGKHAHAANTTISQDARMVCPGLGLADGTQRHTGVHITHRVVTPLVFLTLCILLYHMYSYGGKTVGTNREKFCPS